MSYEANKMNLEGKEPVAEVKTTVYADMSGTQESTRSGQAYAADLVDRTEGNQNWAETGGALGSRSTDYNQQDLKSMANETAYVAGQQSSTSTTGGTMEQGKEKLAHAVDYTKDKLHQATAAASQNAEVGKEKLGETYEAGKEKLGETYDVGAQKLHNAKDYTVESSQTMVDKLKDTVGSTTSALQHKTHEWAESAQHTLEQAREKAREVFTGAGQKVEEAQNKMSSTMSGPSSTTYGSAYQAGDATEIKVKAQEAPSGGIDSIKVEAKSTNAQ